MMYKEFLFVAFSLPPAAIATFDFLLHTEVILKAKKDDMCLWLIKPIFRSIATVAIASIKR